MRSGQEFHAEFRFRDMNGIYRWFRTRAVPIRDSQNQLLKWYGTNTDVDDLKRAEQPALMDASVTHMLNSISEAFIVLTPDLTITGLNSAASKLVGREAGRLIDGSLFEAFPELRGSALHKMLSVAFQSTAELTCEAELAERRYLARVFPNTPRGCISVLLTA